HIFGLATVVAAIEIGVAEHGAAFFLQESTLRPILFRITVLAVSRQVVCTKETPAAGNWKWHYHAIAASEGRHCGANIFDDSHELMPQHHGANLEDAPGVDMEVGAANGGGGNLEND